MSAETVIDIGFGLVFVLLVVAIWRLMRQIPKHAEQRRETDLAVCQQIWDTPYPDLDAGLARLLADIRDDQQKGDQA